MPARKKTPDDSTAPKARKTPVRKAAPKVVATEPMGVEPLAEQAKRARAGGRKAVSSDEPDATARSYDLVIVESPAKAKTINKYLGSGYKVLASVGHIRDLATGKVPKLKEEVSGIQIAQGWKLRYTVDQVKRGQVKRGRSKREILDELAAAAKNANRVLLASDPDREGESIAWHLADELQLDPARTFRIRFNEITKAAIQHAVSQPDQIDMLLVKSQEARRAMDRVVGFPLSNLLGKKVAAGLSAGRVQSVAVRLIVDRELEIAAFRTDEFWKITALLAPQNAGIRYTANPATAKIFAKKKGEKADDANAPDAPTEDTEVANFEGDAEGPANAPRKPVEFKVGLPVPPRGSFLAELAKWNNADPIMGNEAEADAIANVLRTAAYIVTKVEQKERQEKPQAPFTTSTLQQQSNIRLRFTTKRTMDAAQRLYQGIELGSEGTVALITYMRTDSTRCSPDALKAVRDFIHREYGDRYCPDKPNMYSSGKAAQEAHECVRPTDVAMTPQRASSLGLSDDNLKVYTLIWNRFVASQMASAVFSITAVEITAGAGLFRTNGRIEKFEGYRKVMSPAKSEDVLLPPLAEKQPLDKLDLTETQHFTQPPPRFNEASLVKALEKEGIGRPSTYSSIIETVQARGYVEQKERRFYATQIGIVVTKLLVEHFPKIMDMKFTSHFEEELDEIESGKCQYADVLNEFWKPFSESLIKAETDMPTQRGIEIGENCPKCGKPLVAMFSRKTGNKFIGCSGWKDPENPCAFKRSEDGTESAGPEVTTTVCPACGKFMVKKDGRFGVFFTCEGSPDCPTIMNLGADGNPVVSTLPSPVPCPKCGKQLLLKVSKSGNRYVTCSDTKKCKFTCDSDDDGRPKPPPETGVLCDKCNAPMTIRSTFRGPFLACTAYPKCRNAKSLTVELKEKLKDILPAPKPKVAKAPAPVLDVKDACPQCGAGMKLRQYMGKYFLGCNNYPECRGSKQLSPEQTVQIQNPQPPVEA